MNPLQSALHPDLPGCLVDKRATKLECVHGSTINSVAFVLPCSPGSAYEDHGQADQAFPSDKNKNHHYMIIPPRSQWSSFLPSMMKS